MNIFHSEDNAGRDANFAGSRYGSTASFDSIQDSLGFVTGWTDSFVSSRNYEHSDFSESEGGFESFSSFTGGEFESSPSFAESMEGVESSSSFNSNFLSGSGSLMGGALLTTANKDIMSYENNTRLIEAEKGIGPEGHAFQAVADAEIQNNFNSNMTNLENVEIIAGSAFGPEGLLVGAGAAAATALISSNYSPDLSNDGVSNTNST